MKQIWNKFWRDSDSNVVIWQMPNLWLWGWIAVKAVSFFAKHGMPHTILWWLGNLILAVWAALELTKGVNYFRRSLGFIVLAFIIISIIKMYL